MFECIVEPEVFFRARRERMSDEEMLERLRRLYTRKGYLSGIIIDEADDLPSIGMFQRRFGRSTRLQMQSSTTKRKSSRKPG